MKSIVRYHLSFVSILIFIAACTQQQLPLQNITGVSSNQQDPNNVARPCPTNGINCTPKAPGNTTSCLFNGQTFADGSIIQAYQNPSVPSGQQCVAQSRICTHGTLSGNYSFSSCTPEAPGITTSCLFNGQTFTDGSIIQAYQNPSVPSGQQCVAQSRICTHGTLSGNYAFSSCTPEAPGNTTSCLFNGQTFADGSIIQAYQNSTVPSGQQCVAQSRTCTHGTLSGSYAFASCTPARAAILNITMAKSGTSKVTSPDGINCYLDGPVDGCSKTYSPGSSVTLTVISKSGPFLEWIDLDTHRPPPNCNATTAGGTCTISMAGPRNIFANFGLPLVASVRVSQPTASDQNYYFEVWFFSYGPIITDGAALLCGRAGWNLTYIPGTYPNYQANFKVPASGIPVFPSGTWCRIKATYQITNDVSTVSDLFPLVP